MKGHHCLGIHSSFDCKYHAEGARYIEEEGMGGEKRGGGDMTCVALHMKTRKLSAGLSENRFLSMNN